MKRQEVELNHRFNDSSSPRSRLYSDAKLATDTLLEAEESVQMILLEKASLQNEVSVSASPNKTDPDLNKSLQVCTGKAKLTEMF